MSFKLSAEQIKRLFSKYNDLIGNDEISLPDMVTFALQSEQFQDLSKPMDIKLTFF